MARRKHNYDVIRDAFITREVAPTFDAMSEEFKVSARQIFRIYKKEKWKEKRQAFVDEVAVAAISSQKKEAIEHRIGTIRRLRTAQAKILAQILGDKTKENAATLDRLVRLACFLGQEDSRGGGEMRIRVIREVTSERKNTDVDD